MKIGKTIQAIGLFNADTTIKNILITCPASLTLNWVEELVKWTVRKLSGDVANSKHFPNSNIVICSSDIVRKIRHKIDKRKWDLWIADEIHQAKDPNTLRTQSLLGSESKRDCYPIEAQKRIFLTGTPIINRPVDLWPLLRVVDAEDLGASFIRYAEKFCDLKDGPFGRDFSGASNLGLLQERLRARLMIRRLKKDVLKDLPPKRRQIIAIPLPASARKVVEAELNFYDTNQNAIENAIKQADIAQASGDEKSFTQATKDLKGIKHVMFEELAKLRHDTGVAKIPYLIQYLEGVLDEVETVVLYLHHHDVIQPIVEHFKSITVQHHGKMSVTQKQLSVNRFQTDKKIRLFVGAITGAIGYTIANRCSYVLFGEQDWRSTICAQSEDRVHRIGQVENVLIQYFCFDGSLDVRMIKKTIAKQQVIESAVG